MACISILTFSPLPSFILKSNIICFCSGVSAMIVLSAEINMSVGLTSVASARSASVEGRSSLLASAFFSSSDSRFRISIYKIGTDIGRKAFSNALRVCSFLEKKILKTRSWVSFSGFIFFNIIALLIFNDLLMMWIEVVFQSISILENALLMESTI